MKKSIWILALVIVVAAVLIAVFVTQRNTFSDQVKQLEADNAALAQQVTESEMAAKTAQELLKNSQEQAETMLQETTDKLNTVTSERDTLQASAESAASQLDAGIQQLRSILVTLGVEDIEGKTAQELQETKEALSAAETALAESQESVSALTVQRDELQAAVEAGKVGGASAVIRNAEGEAVQELENIGDLDLNALEAGAYTVEVTIRTVGGEDAAQYAFPYVVAAPEEPAAEEPAVEEPAAEEPIAEEPVAEEPIAEEPVAEEPIVEEPADEEPAAEEPVAEEPVAGEPAA